MTNIDSTSTGSEHFDGLSDTWRFRFDFFVEHGTPGLLKTDPGYQAAFRELSFRQRTKLNFNWFGAIFGVLYLLYLRLWKKALVLVALGIVIGMVSILLDLPYSIDRAVAVTFSIYIASRVNVYHYDRRVSGRQTWGL